MRSEREDDDCKLENDAAITKMNKRRRAKKEAGEGGWGNKKN